MYSTLTVLVKIFLVNVKNTREFLFTLQFSLLVLDTKDIFSSYGVLLPSISSE